MLKIRRPLGRLIFNMGIAIPGKTVFLIETAPSRFFFFFFFFGGGGGGGGVTLNPLRTGFIFLCFQGNLCLLVTLRNTDERIFIKLSVNFAHGPRNKLEDSQDVAASPLNPGSICLFPGPVFVSSVMKKRGNGLT